MNPDSWKLRIFLSTVAFNSATHTVEVPRLNVSCKPQKISPKSDVSVLLDLLAFRQHMIFLPCLSDCVYFGSTSPFTLCLLHVFSFAPFIFQLNKPCLLGVISFCCNSVSVCMCVCVRVCVRVCACVFFADSL